MKIVDILDRICSLLMQEKVIVYSDPDDKRRRLVLEKLVEFYSHTGDSVKFIDVADILQDFFKTLDIERLQREFLDLEKYDIVVIDNFDVGLFIKGVRIVLEGALSAYVRSDRGSLVLASTDTALSDPDVSKFLKQLGANVIVRYEEEELKTENKIVTLLKAFVKRFIKNLESESVTVV